MEDAMQNSNDDGLEGEFIHLSLIDSSFAKVIFQDVKDVYSADEDLVCTYIVVANSQRAQLGDSIRLFRVGWSDVRDYVASVQCQLCSDQELGRAKTELSVIFGASVLLLRDEGDFYQFCYITADDEIRGASTPFLLRSRSSVDDLVTESDIENDLLLIRTRTTILEDNLQKTMKEKTTAQAEKQFLEKKACDQQLLIDSLQDLITTRAEVIKVLQGDLKTSENSIKQKETALEDALHEKQILEESLNKTTAERDRLKEANDVIDSRLKERQNMVSRLVAEVASQKLTVGSLLHQRKLLNLTIDSSENEIRELKEKLVNEAKERELLFSNAEDTKNMLDAMETSKRLALEELEEKRRQQLNVLLNTTMKHMEVEVNTLKSNDEAQCREIERLAKELEEKSASNSSLKAENSTLSADWSRAQEENLKLQEMVTDLRYRLKMGADEYKRKYIEWFKLQKRCVKMENKLKKKSSGASVGSVDEQTNISGTASQCTSSAANVSTDSEFPCDASACVRNLSLEQKRTLVSEMENQLLKFQTSNNSQPFTVTESMHDKQVLTATTKTCDMPEYPYPPFYPYPYPASCPPTAEQQICQDNVTARQQYDVIASSSEFLDRRSPSPANLSDYSIFDLTAAENYIFCPVCSQMFHCDVDMHVVNTHIEEHFMFLCPICGAQFDKESEQEVFRGHVNNHLDNDNKDI